MSDLVSTPEGRKTAIQKLINVTGTDDLRLSLAQVIAEAVKRIVVMEDAEFEREVMEAIEIVAMPTDAVTALSDMAHDGPCPSDDEAQPELRPGQVFEVREVNHYGMPVVWAMVGEYGRWPRIGERLVPAPSATPGVSHNGSSEN